MKRYIKSSTGYADLVRKVFNKFKKARQDEWGLQIDDGDVIAWTDDSGDPLRMLSLQDVLDDSSLDQDSDADDIYEACYDNAESLDYGEAVEAFEEHGLEVPEWLLDEM